MTDQPPKVFEYALQLYRNLEAESKDGLWEGSKTAAFRNLGVSQSYYSRIYGTLQELGCIEQIHKGAGEGFGRASVLRLHHAPEIEPFGSTYAARKRQRLTIVTQVDTLRQDVEQLKGRLPEIDLNRYILSFEQRLTDIESRLAAIEGR
jgi:hypothetical protein